MHRRQHHFQHAAHSRSATRSCGLLDLALLPAMARALMHETRAADRFADRPFGLPDPAQTRDPDYMTTDARSPTRRLIEPTVFQRRVWRSMFRSDRRTANQGAHPWRFGRRRRQCAAAESDPERRDDKANSRRHACDQRQAPIGQHQRNVCDALADRNRHASLGQTLVSDLLHRR